ncbi:TRP-domain-containing protein [Laetiporus sulphureus 93-53]|uniref:TRP-domain-containing protein n=1 Tax=Laetiporus sulphureus 93-53 TaxID=1314785 RepID=A0A165GZM6_9APHY|nr:TRP-domain-containing protein [Laetiporus sulphureus 93-53]KZT11047.1 TRP-domain-containing protein [Laetiporus sulphureus 93-53]
MFFSVARLRHTLLSSLLFSAFTYAHERVIYTSSVSYCSQPQEILVEQLYIEYYPANNSIFFNVSAASVLDNLNVTANLYLNDYGAQPINYTLDICSLFGGFLCPLPQYNFTGSDWLTIPSSVDITKVVPGIAYIIPDLESFAQVTLLEVGTGDVKACLQATLANGWSTHQYAVEWTTAAIALLALASALLKSVFSNILALAPIRFLDLLYLYQTIASSALLGLNYPTIYTSFALNFSWVLGLFAQSSTSSMQNSINRMRSLTGGDDSDASSGGSTAYVNRRLSPYNTDIVFQASKSLVAKARSLPTIDLFNSTARSLLTRATLNSAKRSVQDDIAVVTSEDGADVLQAGIPIYVNDIGIATADAFMTIFLTALIYAAIVLGALALGFGIYFGLRRTSWGKQHLRDLPAFESGYLPFARAWALRAVLITVLPILTFIFYQWTLHDSWLSVLLSVITLVIMMALVLPPIYFVIRPYLPRVLARTTTATVPTSHSLAPLTAPFRSERVWYVGALLIAIIVKAMVTAFGHAHGLAQAIVLLILDVLFFVSLIVFKPYRTRGADVLQGFLATVRMVCSGLLIAFAQTLSVSAIPRVAIGVVIAVIFAIAVIIMFLNILVNLGLWRLFMLVVCCGRRGRRGDRALASNPSDSDSAMLRDGDGDKDKDLDVEKFGEKMPTGGESHSPGSSQVDFLRPGNPSPPATAMHTPVTASSEHPSVFSSSTETTLGEPLPRRWSFQHSRPPSESEGSQSTGSFATASPTTPSSAYHARRQSRNLPMAAPATIPERYSHEE